MLFVGGVDMKEQFGVENPQNSHLIPPIDEFPAKSTHSNNF
jgi:hypothetical protein